MQVFRGTSLMSENTLLDLPTGVVTFHMDTTEPRVPAIAVASGAYIYIYKNLRPYFKFTLPTLEVNPSEFDLWTQVSLGGGLARGCCAWRQCSYFSEVFALGCC